MNIRVEHVDSEDKAGWQVRLNDKPVFSCFCQAEAESFAEQLAARVKAPHGLPAMFFEVDHAFAGTEPE